MFFLLLQILRFEDTHIKSSLEVSICIWVRRPIRASEVWLILGYNFLSQGRVVEIFVRNVLLFLCWPINVASGIILVHWECKHTSGHGIVGMFPSPPKLSRQHEAHLIICSHFNNTRPGCQLHARFIVCPKDFYNVTRTAFYLINTSALKVALPNTFDILKFRVVANFESLTLFKELN